LRGLIGVKPEVIQCAPANRVRVLVLCKRFRVPSNGIGRLSNSPGHAAVTQAVKRAIVCPAGVLRRSVKPDVTYVDPGAQRHTEGLNSAVEVHVKQGILIVPYTRRRVGYFVAHQPHAIVTRIGLNLIDCGVCSCPRLDSRLHSDRRTDGRKIKKARAARNREPAIRVVVKHVALRRMRLAPRILMRADVSRFAKIAGSRILRRDQITRLHNDPVRHAIMAMAAMIIGGTRKRTSERVNPGARADASLITIEARSVWVGTARAQMRTCLAATGVTIAANEVFQGQERVFHPRLADLFEARIVVCTAAHAIEILRNDWVISLRQRKPIHWLVTIVTGVRPYGQPDLCAVASLLVHIFDISNDNIGTGHKIRHARTHCMLHGRQHHRFRLTFNKVLDLDRLHRSAH